MSGIARIENGYAMGWYAIHDFDRCAPLFGSESIPSPLPDGYAYANSLEEAMSLEQVKALRIVEIDQEVIAGQLWLNATGTYLTRKQVAGVISPAEEATADYLAGLYEASEANRMAGEAAKTLVEACETVAAVWAVAVVWPEV